MRCETCLHGRAVVSENGIHYICGLSEEEAMNCLLRKEDRYFRNPFKKTPKED